MKITNWICVYWNNVVNFLEDKYLQAKLSRKKKLFNDILNRWYGVLYIVATEVLEHYQVHNCHLNIFTHIECVSVYVCNACVKYQPYFYTFNTIRIIIIARNPF